MPGWLKNRPGFSGGEGLTYRLRSVATPGPPRAAFHEGTIEVTASSEAARDWVVAEEVGLYAQAGGLQIIIEKDFRCLTLPDCEEPDAYPHSVQSSHDRR